MTQQEIKFIDADELVADNNHFTNKLKHPTLDGITVSFVQVTPELADLWLDSSVENQRKISPITVERYSADMAMDAWKFSGDPIRFDYNGHMIDGQHRCTAIQETGTSQIILVIEGLDPDTMPVIDTGRKRTYSDIIKMRNMSNHTIISGMVTRVWHWEHGNYGRRSVARRHDAIHVNAMPTMQQLDTVFFDIQKRGIDWVAAARWGWQLNRTTGGTISPGLGGLAYCLFTQIDVDLREEFSHHMFVEAPNGRSTYPPTQLVNTALRRKGEGIEDHIWLHYIITCWNAWRKGEDVGQLRKPSTVSPDSLAYPTGLVERA